MCCVFMESHCSDATFDRQACFEGTEGTEEKEMSLSKDSSINEELVAAVSWIHDFVLVMGNEATAVQEHLLMGIFISTFESNATSWKCSLEEFEQLKLEKDNMVLDLESTKAQLQGAEQLLAEVKSQLASAQKWNSLAETQLKCMAESFKSLETCAEYNVQKDSCRINLRPDQYQASIRRNESCRVANVDVTINQVRVYTCIHLVFTISDLFKCSQAFTSNFT
ncbi:Filament-like plant protein 4 [Camellia lanceoleosa]|uniref:Filament-like plant protein 4 n=1 Tax=Camellia lanceoleosa TaxID=1840588 RepID=A0ACC0GSY6_9ERIC|nr:Filament-like plant protein 4 [Camellia lanceoleosa]